MGIVPAEVDMDQLRIDVDEMRETYYNVSLHEIGLGQAINDLFTLAFRHKMQIPTELTLLAKSFLTTEGVVAALDPTFSVFDIAEPMGKKLFMDRLDPWQKVKDWIEDVPEYLDLLSGLPANFKQLSALLRRGKLRIEVDMPQTDALMKKMDRISNRLSFSIVLLALSIVRVGLIIGAALSGAPTLLWKLPIIEIGFGIALFMVLWLIYSIFRSGRF